MAPEAALALVPKAENMEIEALDFAGMVKQMKIVDGQTYQGAGEFLKDINTRIKAIDEEMGPKVQDAHNLHKSLVSLRDRLKAPYMEAKKHIGSEMAAYDMEQERIREEEERRLAEAARKEEEERRLAEAEAAEKAGDIAEAQAIIEEPVYVPPVVVEKSTPKVAGIAMVTNWKFQIVDASKVPDQYKTIDEVAIGRVVRALKDKCNIPGIRVYAEKGVRSGSR